MVSLHDYDRIWFLTWTTYGTWLPGDERGFVSDQFEGPVTEKRNNTPGTQYDPGRPVLKELAHAIQKSSAVWLQPRHAELLQPQFEETARFRGWTILAGAVMSNHVHLVVGVSGDPEPSMLLKDFKSYGSRVLNRVLGRTESGHWWTDQGSKRKIKDQAHLNAVLRYVVYQSNPLCVWSLKEVGDL